MGSFACISRTVTGVPTCRGVVAPVAAARTSRVAATWAAAVPSGPARLGAGLASTVAIASPEVALIVVALTTYGPRIRGVAMGPLDVIVATGAARRPQTEGATGQIGVPVPVALCMGRAQGTTAPNRGPGHAYTLAGVRAAARRRQRAAVPRPPASDARSRIPGRSAPRTVRTAVRSRMAVERPAARTTASHPRTGRRPPRRAAAPRATQGATAKTDGRRGPTPGPYAGPVGVRGTTRTISARAALPCAAEARHGPLKGRATVTIAEANRTEKEIRAILVASLPDCH